MHSLLFSLVAVGFTVHAAQSPVRLRKTLGFGPPNPNAVFYSNPYQIVTNSFNAMSPDTDPFHVTISFLDDILPQSHSSYYSIRDDSYTDKNTGVTHVYVRQFVNGIEVTDGYINLNIKDGMVLSYGDSVSLSCLSYPTRAHAYTYASLMLVLHPNFSQMRLTRILTWNSAWLSRSFYWRTVATS
jgi:Zn-dependent metalloprotease